MTAGCWQSRVQAAAAATAPFPDHLKLGVSTTFLWELVDMMSIQPGELTCDVAARVAELTGVERSLAELYRCCRTQDGQQAVGMATCFVSHAQRASFLNMVDAIGLHAAMNLTPTFFWIDFASIRQGAIAEDLPHLAMVRKIARDAVVIVGTRQAGPSLCFSASRRVHVPPPPPPRPRPADGLVCPLVTSRAFCLYEMALAPRDARGLRFHCALSRSHLRLLFRMDEAMQRAVLSMIARSADMLLAQTSFPEDRVAVHEQIRLLYPGAGNLPLVGCTEDVRRGLLRGLGSLVDR